MPATPRNTTERVRQRLLCTWQTWQRPTLPRLKTKYHRRRGVSRPSSEWDRVQPPRHNHQVGKVQRIKTSGRASGPYPFGRRFYALSLSFLTAHMSLRLTFARNDDANSKPRVWHHGAQVRPALSCRRRAPSTKCAAPSEEPLPKATNRSVR